MAEPIAPASTPKEETLTSKCLLKTDRELLLIIRLIGSIKIFLPL